MEGQENQIIDYCKRNNINLIKIYRDEGISGKDIDSRDDFKEMITYSMSNGIDTIISFKLSRFTRNARDLMNTIHEIEKKDISLVLIEDGIDTSTSMGKSMCYIAGIFAEMELESTSDFVTMTMERNAMNGNWNGGVVYGYDSNEDKELIINEDERIIVEKIFSLYTEEGWGYKKIANHLNHKNIKTKRDLYWSINSIKQIIDNPIYSGQIRWGQHRDWAKKRRKGKSEEYILVEGKHKAIISRETWEKTLELRNIRGIKADRTYEGEYLLSGLIRCPQCGSPMISHRTKKKNSNDYYEYYQCSTFVNKGTSVCSSNLIHSKLAEKTILQKINEFVKDPNIIKALSEKMQEKNVVDIKPHIKEVKEINLELNKLEKKKKENLQLRFDEMIDMQTLSEMNLFLRDKEKELLSKLVNLETTLHNIQNSTVINSDELQIIFENFDILFENANVQQKKKLLKSIIDEIHVTNSKDIKERTVSQIKFHFEPQDVSNPVAYQKQNYFATDSDTVHLS